MCEPRIYVACLAAYNNGYLHGEWVDATLDLEDIQAAVREMLAQSPIPEAEEYAIHDHEGFCGYEVGEYEGIDTLHAIVCFIEEHGEIAGEVLNHFGGNLEEARTAIEENYRGCFTSLADFAQELTEETGGIPKHLEFYIDYERMAHDLEMSGDIFTIKTGFEEIHIFWSR